MEAPKPKIEPSESAKEAVLVANTASFIFKRLREDATVRYIADTHTAREIVEWFNVNAERFSNDVNGVVLGYMYLVALSMKDASEALVMLRTVPLAALEWGPAIGGLIEAKAIGTSKIIRVDAPQRKAVAMSSSIDAGVIISDPSKLSVRQLQ